MSARFTFLPPESRSPRPKQPSHEQTGQRFDRILTGNLLHDIAGEKAAWESSH
jgi:hypothetical protein